MPSFAQIRAEIRALTRGTPQALSIDADAATADLIVRYGRRSPRDLPDRALREILARHDRRR